MPSVEEERRIAQNKIKAQKKAQKVIGRLLNRGDDGNRGYVYAFSVMDDLHRRCVDSLNDFFDAQIQKDQARLDGLEIKQKERYELYKKDGDGVSTTDDRLQWFRDTLSKEKESLEMECEQLFLVGRKKNDPSKYVDTLKAYDELSDKCVDLAETIMRSKLSPEKELKALKILLGVKHQKGTQRLLMKFSQQYCGVMKLINAKLSSLIDREKWKVELIKLYNEDKAFFLAKDIRNCNLNIAGDSITFSKDPQIKTDFFYRWLVRMQQSSPSTQELVNDILDLCVLDSVERWSHRHKKIIDSINPTFLEKQRHHLLASPSNASSIVSEDSPYENSELERFPKSLFGQIGSLDSVQAIKGIFKEYYQYELDSAKRYGKVGGLIEVLESIKGCCSAALDVGQKVDELIISLRRAVSDFEKSKSENPRDIALHQEKFKIVEAFISDANKMSGQIESVLERVDKKSPEYIAYQSNSEKVRKSPTNLPSTLDAEVHFDADYGASHQSKVIDVLAKILTWLRNNESNRPEEPVNRQLDLEFESVDQKKNRFSLKK